MLIRIENSRIVPEMLIVSEQVCSSPCSSLNISESCPVSDKEPLLVPEGASSTPCFFQSILRETEEQNSGANTSWQNKPHESSTEELDIWKTIRTIALITFIQI